MAGMLESPWLVPVPIKTYYASNWEQIKALVATRYFCLGKDWYYTNSLGETCVIPGAFNDDDSLKPYYYVTDGKSYPRPVRPFLNNMGIGLTEGLVHDFAYRYRCQILMNGSVIRKGMSKLECDIELREVGIQTNNIPWASSISYNALRIGGGLAWRFHRSRDYTDFNSLHLLLRDYTPRDPLAEMPVMAPFLA